jgi:type IV pilus assembly protein PilY1
MNTIGTNNKLLYHCNIAILIILLMVDLTSWALPTLAISQVPLQSISPGHPQVLIAIANSESMDGTLSGAIMTGSGSIGTPLNSLNNSSSPVNYQVPSGFTPPAQAANAAGVAPYTVLQNTLLIDNGASRLNVAKAGIQAIIQTYIQNTDFALEIYNTSNTNLYTTWVYYMSPNNGNFTFTNTQISSNRYITNPCYGYMSALTSTTVAANCALIAPLYGTTTGPMLLSTNQYMQIGASSDDSNINDILYSFGQSGIFVTYNGPKPASPYPPNFTLANYNKGSIYMKYSSSLPNSGPFSSSPTNAGYVPFSLQVMYSERGFGYGGSQSATTGTVIVPMTSAGASPTTSSISNAVNTFLPYLKPETNSLLTTEIKSVAGQSPFAGLLTTAKTYLTGSSLTTGCSPKKYVVFISDGLPTEDLSGNYWPPLGSASATGYNVSATFNTDGSLNTTNDQALTDTITAIKALNAAGINTFIIGLGAGVDPTLNSLAAATLTAMAIAGGTTTYYPATSPAALVTDLNAILLTVQGGSISTTSAVVNSTSLKSNIVEYQANYTANDMPYNDWTGNLVEIAINPKTGVPTGAPIWAAQGLLDSQAVGTGINRIIATWNPLLNNGIGDGVPFEWSTISAAQKALLQPNDLQGQSRLQYLRGNTSLEVRNGGTFRNRSHLLGDIVNSQPLYVGPPAGPYLYSTSYTNFEKAQANRQPLLFAGANDGMLHAFSATTGVEKFAFIPNAVFRNLTNLTALVYNQSHLFFVDSPPYSADVQFSDASWHTLLVGGEGAGGSSIYALDITDPANITSETALANLVLWEFRDNDMGLSYSIPQIAPINPSSTTQQPFAVFFGNGYNSPNNTAVLYALNPQTGAVIAKLNFCTALPSACNPLLPQGLSSIAVGNLDGIQGQAIDEVYAGDLQGNLWAVDVSSNIPSQWKVRLLFQARDSSGSGQPIITQPLVTLHPLYPRLQGLFLMFGTGQLLTLNDLTTSQTETVYGIWDKLSANTVFTRANLQAQYLTVVNAATSGLSNSIIINTNNTINWGSIVGWYADLPIAGQRIVTPSELLNGAFIAILNLPPPTTNCNASFTSMLLELNYLTGGAFYRPQLDINNSGIITNADQYNGVYVSGIGLTSGFANSPAIIGPNANNNMNKIVTQSNGSQTMILNPNNSPRITGWWQVQ